jgi:putative addiction module component (TIGR02574 family)
MAKPAIDLTALTPDEKLELIDEIWGSLEPDDFALDDAQRAELDRRLADLDRDGPVGTPWDVVRAKMSRARS